MNIKVKTVGKKLLALLLIPFILSGCAKSNKKDCDIPTDHVHKYTLNTDKGSLTTYINSDELKYGIDNWTINDDYITITSEDKEFYDAKDALFNGKDNWEYLYNFMASKHDYLEYYYEYETSEMYYDLIQEIYRSKKVTKKGWSVSPHCVGATGYVRLCHYRFYGYKIVYQDGEYKEVISPMVDDIREIIDEYPYFRVYPATIRHSHREYDKEDLDNVKISDFDGIFIGPDLENHELYSKEIGDYYGKH